MNIKHMSINPIELLRLKQELTQAEFAQKLELDSLGQYHRYLKICSPKLLAAISDVFGQDLHNDVIAYLVGEQKRCRKELARFQTAQVSSMAGSESRHPATDPVAYMDSLIDNLK